jgi:hypothetical protein
MDLRGSSRSCIDWVTRPFPSDFFCPRLAANDPPCFFRVCTCSHRSRRMRIQPRLRQSQRGWSILLQSVHGASRSVFRMPSTADSEVAAKCLARPAPDRARSVPLRLPDASSPWRNSNRRDDLLSKTAVTAILRHASAFPPQKNKFSFGNRSVAGASCSSPCTERPAPSSGCLISIAECQQAGRPVGQDSRDGYPPPRLRTFSPPKKFNFPKKILRPPKKNVFYEFKQWVSALLFRISPFPCKTNFPGKTNPPSTNNKLGANQKHHENTACNQIHR